MAYSKDEAFDTHKDCVEYGYRVAHGTFKSLEDTEEMTQEYIENSRIIVRFDCRAVEVPKQIVPPPKPKTNA